MSEFRVIILGAGPAGLFAAHALAAANIDFVVLERQPEIVRYRGAFIVAWPPLVRLMDQLGLYKQMLELSTPIITKTHFTTTGEPLCSAPVFGAIGDELGYPSLGISRGDLLKVLYESLPDHETKVKANMDIVNIETREDGVRVYLDDQTVVDGSVVIAADGVHSSARELIQGLGMGVFGSGNLEPASPMIAGYLSLFGRAPIAGKDIALGDFAESHGPGVVSQSTRVKDAMYFTIIKRLDEPATGKHWFTTEDTDKFAQEMADVTIFPGFKFGEIWPLCDKDTAKLTYQEEGLAKKWYHGRVVLLGDAVHKMTSVNGSGAMTAALSAVVLVNNLRAALQKNPNPTVSELRGVFVKYVAMRMPVATAMVEFGALLTRFVTWTDKGIEAWDRQESTKGSMLEQAKGRLLPLLSQSPVLDFVPFESKYGPTRWGVASPDATS
ncbi:hypothetical protein GGR51DRAFT_521613 [Nemania sp. FL0031]|nr:hypothetical protein GGR51DRAFT_521613 [Nemania sp. FL0031]